MLLERLAAQRSFHALAPLEAAAVLCRIARDRVQVRSMSSLSWGLELGLTIGPSRCRRLLELLG